VGEIIEHDAHAVGHAAARFAADRVYLEALRRGDEPVGARWGKRT
jgi:hypothetical protein